MGTLPALVLMTRILHWCLRKEKSLQGGRLGRNTTQTYLNDLKELASRSGENFEDVLKGMLAQMQEMVVPNPHPELVRTEVNDTPSAPLADPSLTDFSLKQSQATANAAYRSIPLVSAATGPESPSLTAIDLNPPGVQRVVVEHLVRSTDLTVHGSSPLRLRVFSGRISRPPSEVEYETWRTGVELLLQDPTVSDYHRVRRICESLLSPAVDIVKSVGLTASPSTYLQLLDSAFATIEDADELFAKFLNVFQNPGEKPSAYLRRLHVALQSAMRQSGVLGSDIDKHLLKQICRGCWESSLITELQLERKKLSPPTFAELMTLLRTLESKHVSKNACMKQHLGGVKQPAVMQSQLAAESDVTRLNPITAHLASQIAELQSQLAMLTSKQSRDKPNPKLNPFKSSNQGAVGSKGKPRVPDKRHPVRLKPGYCFRCGEDGHIASSCSNDPNPALVSEKREKFARRQSEWDMRNGSLNEQLN
ncbi:hypothetical protein QTP70_015905 [Hemibagrus guttatus]|uniref:CCHC-type domain-containing protein n=1 Tax=Hemibagrus guttatus TaxID=175788 RepID=A0AAE0PT15_9TELE|nr:hypothetical protein QTP70_015905 [Hemibagrus guttatus]